MRTAFFWVITQRVVVISYRRLGTNYQSHLQISIILSSRVKNQFSWPLKMGQIGCPETSVRNYHHSLCSNPEERSSHLLVGGSHKSRTDLYMWRHGVSSQLIFLHASMAMYCQGGVGAARFVRVGRLTVSGNTLLIVVFVRHKSSRCF